MLQAPHRPPEPHRAQRTEHRRPRCPRTLPASVAASVLTSAPRIGSRAGPVLALRRSSDRAPAASAAAALHRPSSLAAALLAAHLPAHAIYAPGPARPANHRPRQRRPANHSPPVPAVLGSSPYSPLKPRSRDSARFPPSPSFPGRTPGRDLNGGAPARPSSASTAPAEAPPPAARLCRLPKQRLR